MTINKRSLKEERMQTQFYTGLTTPLCLCPVPKQPAWEFHYLVKSFLQCLKHTRTTLPLCLDNLTTRDPWSLNQFSWIRKGRRRILSFKRKIIQWRSLNDSLLNLQVFWPRNVFEDKTILFLRGFWVFLFIK